MAYAGESFGNAGKKGKNAFVESIVMRKLGLRGGIVQEYNEIV